VYSLFLKGAFQDSNSIVHPLQEGLHLDLKSSQALRPLGQNPLHLPFPVENRLDFLLGHLLFDFLFHLFGPRQFIQSRFHGDLLLSSCTPLPQGGRGYFGLCRHRVPDRRRQGDFNLAKKQGSGKRKVFLSGRGGGGRFNRTNFSPLTHAKNQHRISKNFHAGESHEKDHGDAPS